MRPAVWGIAVLSRSGIAVVLTAAAHALTWVALVFFVLGPVYQGVEETAVPAGELATAASTGSTSSLIQVNGWGVLPLLLFPVGMTGLALAAAFRSQLASTRWSLWMWRISQWASAFLLLVFCAIAIFTIGLFYVPSAVLLIAAAAIPMSAPADAPRPNEPTP